MQTISHEDRCIGCLLGTACGDILGAAVEGSSAREIRELYGEIRDFAESGRGFGWYTDDTQMTLALARSLVECGLVDAAHASSIYAEFYEPWRGSGERPSRHAATGRRRRLSRNRAIAVSRGLFRQWRGHADRPRGPGLSSCGRRRAGESRRRRDHSAPTSTRKPSTAPWCRPRPWRRLQRPTWQLSIPTRRFNPCGQSAGRKSWLRNSMPWPTVCGTTTAMFTSSGGSATGFGPHRPWRPRCGLFCGTGRIPRSVSFGPWPLAVIRIRSARWPAPGGRIAWTVVDPCPLVRQH